jgi:hypothetical protein
MFKECLVFILASSLFHVGLSPMEPKFSEEEQSEIVLQASKGYPRNYKNKHSGLTPEKGSLAVVSLDSPKKRALGIKASVNKKETRIIYSDDTDFSEDFWLYFDPLDANCPVGVDADLPLWSQLIRNFKAHKITDNLEYGFNVNDFERLLIALSDVLANNINNIHKASFFNAAEIGEDEPECRNFSTYMLVLFSKFIKSSRYLWGATIQLASADIVDSDCKRLSGESHTWNFVTVYDGSSRHYWYLDAVNHILVKLDPAENLDNQLARIFKPFSALEIRRLDQEFYINIRDFCKLSLDKFVYALTDNTNIFHDDKQKQREIMAAKMASATPRNLKIGSKPIIIKSVPKKRERDFSLENQEPKAKKRLFPDGQY